MDKYQKLENYRVEKDEFSNFVMSCHFDISFFTRFPIKSHTKLTNIIIDKFKIIILEKGNVDLLVNGYTYTLNPYDVVLMPPMCLHSAEAHGGEVILYEIFFNFERFSKEYELINMLNLVTPKKISLDPHDINMDNINSIYNSAKANKFGAYLECIFLISKVLSHFANEEYITQFSKNNNNSAAELINSMISYVENNYMYPISVKDICNELKVSQSYLYRCSMAILNISPNNYILYFKMAKADRLLKIKDLSIEEIAEMTGYENIYHFSNTFKKHFGISPSSYRKQSY